MKWLWLRDRVATLPPLLIDGALALGLGLVGAAQLVHEHHGGGGGGPGGGPGANPGLGGPGPGPSGGTDLLSYMLVGFCAASLLPRRRYPLLSLAGVTAFGAAFLSRGDPAFAVQLIVLVAIYTAVADSALSRPAAVLTAVAASAVLGLAILASDAPRSNATWAMDAAWVIAAIFLGDSVRSRREFAVESERSRDEEARRRISDERLQIARELHDVVGHNLSLISVQAGAGAHVLYGDPAQARETFENIRNTSHETLQELRSMVGVLREPLQQEARSPTVGLDAVEQLVKSIADAGQTIELEVTGEPHDLAGVVDLSAYRILQEALTNTVRHAPGARVKVTLHYDSAGVSLEVTNGRGAEGAPRESGGGQGLLGMKERATAIGGELEAGPQPDGGFRVRAVLPVSRAAT